MRPKFDARTLAYPLLLVAAIGFLQLPQKSLESLESGDALSDAGRYVRDLDNLRFPNHPVTNDVGDILETYPDYLKFVVEAGKATNAPLAKRLEEKYAALEKADRGLAARFLRGLRFEMVQKLELTGLANRGVTTAQPGVRRWVGRFLGIWLREADEYMFRARAGKIARRNED